MFKFETKNIDGNVGVPAYSHTLLREKTHPYVLIVPVLNEDGRLLMQLASIQAGKFPVDIVIADGGSTDNSTEPSVLFDFGVSSLLVKTGPGKLSGQLRMAFSWCLEQGYLGAITMDGNNKDGAEGILRILEALEEGFDFVQGSRFVPGGKATNTPKIRDFAIRLIHAPITSVASRFRYTDTTNGFRGFSKELISSGDIAIFREIFDTYELIFYLPIRASRLAFKVCEVPVHREYPQEGPTPTKIKGLNSYIKLLRILFSASTGKYNPRRVLPTCK